MTGPELGAEGLRFVAAFLLLLFAYFHVFRKSRLSSFRQDLFFLRNRLWQLAHDNGCLDHPSHRALRDLLNGTIRIAPRLNALHVLLLPVLSPASEKSTSVFGSIESIKSKEVRDAFVHTAIEYGRICCWYLFLESFPACIVFWPLCALVWLLATTARINALLRRLVETTELELPILEGRA